MSRKDHYKPSAFLASAIATAAHADELSDIQAPGQATALSE